MNYNAVIPKTPRLSSKGFFAYNLVARRPTLAQTVATANGVEPVRVGVERQLCDRGAAVAALDVHSCYVNHRSWRAVVAAAEAARVAALEIIVLVGHLSEVHPLSYVAIVG